MTSRAGTVHGTTGIPSRPTIPNEPSSGVGPAPMTEPQSDRTRPCPHQSELVLGALPSAVPCARLHAKAVLHEWGLDALAESVELVVSEIVTNAVIASEGLADDQPFPPTVHVWLSADDKHVAIQVWDANNRMPQKLEPDLDAVGGRGLLLVEAMSESCGAYRLEDGNGKIAWAKVGPQ